MARRTAQPQRHLRTAEVLAVGSELTAGETRDTNGGDIARDLSIEGVSIRRLLALPDDLALVTRAFRDALAAVDLVVATGGLGPTPDDLTREAVAAAVGETPDVDRRQEAWLRRLFERRGVRLPEANLKQAWLIPSARAIPNRNGTAPGWWVEAGQGRLVVLLPGPPRELRPMWRDWVLPRLRERGLGDRRVVRTLRTYGIGESHVAELLGEALLRGANPVVATYARADWLDVRVSAVDEGARDGSAGRRAADVVDATAALVRELLAGHVIAEGETTWGELVDEACARRGWRLATVEAGTGGTLGGLLAERSALARSVAYGPGLGPDVATWPAEEEAAEAAKSASADVGLALAAHTDGRQTLVRAAVAVPATGLSRLADLRLFQHGAQGRFRAAVAAAAFLLEALAEPEAVETETAWDGTARR